MKVFCSDLDNTLIYSYKHDIGENKVLVEKKEEKELSYMTVESYKLLESIKNKIEFIPVTTRSLEQYQRIKFSDNWIPQYALVANGGILLMDGKIDSDWFKESKRRIKESDSELEKGIGLLKKDSNISFEVRKINELFVFSKSDNPYDTVQYLQNELNTEQVSIHMNGNKVYIFPKVLNKGMAIERIREVLSPEYIFAAGDSDFDIPMIQKADKGFYPQTLSDSFFSKESIRIKDKLFSDGLLNYIYKLI